MFKILLKITLLICCTSLSAQLNLNLTQTESVCSSDGSITARAVGNGTEPYQYRIVSGPEIRVFQSSETFLALQPGNYTVEVRDATFTTASNSITVAGSYTLPSLTVGITPPTCASSSNGQVILTGSNGNLIGTSAFPTYKYRIVDLSTTPQTVLQEQNSDTFSGLSEGTYSFQIEDGCQNTVSETLTLSAPSIVSLSGAIDFLEKVACDTYEADYSSFGRGVFPHDITVNEDISGTIVYSGSSSSSQGVSIGTNYNFDTAYTVNVVDACGQTDTLNFSYTSTIDMWSQKSSDCSGETSFFVYANLNNTSARQKSLLVPVTVTFTNQTDASDVLVYTLNDPDYLEVEISEADIEVGGTYDVVMQDSCNFIVTSTETFTPVDPTEFIADVREERGCMDGTTGMSFHVRNGGTNYGRVTITSGPASFTSEGGVVTNYSYPKVFEDVNNTSLYPVGFPPGNYQAVLTDGCETGNVSFEILASDTVQHDFSLDFEQRCGNSNALIINPNVIKADGGSFYTNVRVNSLDSGDTVFRESRWFFEEGVPVTIPNMPAGDYQLNLEFQSGGNCSSTNTFTCACEPQTVNITIPEYVSTSFESIVGYTCTEGSGVIFAEGSSGVAPYTYEIIASSIPANIGRTSTDGIFTNTAEGTYTVRISDSCGNSADGAFEVTPYLPSLVATCDSSGDQVTLSANPVPNATFTWINSSGTTVQQGTSNELVFNPFDPSLGGDYTLQVTAPGLSCTIYDGSITVPNIPCSDSIDAAKTIESGPIYNSATDDYTVTYRITVENIGGLAGSYDVVDTFLLGTGFTLTNATLAYGGESDGVDGTILTPFISGDQVITSESLAGLRTESWLVTATFTVDKDLFDPTQDCTSGGGFGNQITVTGDTDSSNDTACVPVDIAEIELVKEGLYVDTDSNGLTNVGDEIVYTFVVLNRGNLPLSNVVVSDPLLGGAVPGPASGDTDGDGELDMSETWVYNASYDFSQTDIDNGQVNNLATVNSEDPDGNTVTRTSTDPTPCSACTPDPTCPDCTMVYLPRNPSIDAAKTIESGPQYNSATDDYTVIYRITVANSGDRTGSYDVVDTFTLGTGLTLTNATLAYGGEPDGTDGIVLSPFNSGNQIITDESLVGLRAESWLVTATYEVDRDIFDPTQDCTNGGGFGNQITVTGDTDPSNDTACVPVAIGRINITKDGVYIDSDANGLTNVGDVVDYTFVVTNTGNVAISNVIVSDPLLGGAIAGPASGDADGDGELDSTETWVYTASYSIIQTDIDNGQVNNLATVTGEDPDGTTVTDTSTDPTPCTTCTPDPTCTDCTLTELPSNPSIDAAKTIESGPIYNSATDEHTVTYRITVTNSGELSGSYDVVDTFTLGTGFTLTNATLVYGGETDGVDGTILTPFTSGDQVITGESLAGLQTESWLVTATFTVDKDLFDPSQDCTNGGGFGNQITVTGDTNSSNDTACVPVAIGGIEITKDGVYVNSDTNGLTNVGDVIDYTFVVTNTGNVAISTVVVSDPLLGGAIAGPASGDTDGDGELDVTETWNYTASYTITQTDIDNGQVNNLATVTGEDPDGTTVTDTSTDPTPCATCTPDPTCTDCTLTELPSNPSIDAAKTIESGPIYNSATDDYTVTYRITVTNSGELSGSYDVVDTFTLGTGFSLTNATLVYGGETDGVDGTILTPFTSGDQVITGESLAGLQTESWLVTATFTVDKDLFDPSQDCTNGGGFGNQIIVTGDTDPSNDTACVPVEIGGIEITKDGVYIDSDTNGLTNVGDAVDYTFVVTNNGNVAISNVIVSDPLLGGAIAGPASGDTDGNGELDITETWVYTASYSIIQTDIDNGQVNNLATVTGEDPDGNTVTDTSTDPTPCATCTPDPTCTDCTLTELPSNPSIDAAKTIESGPIYNSATDEHTVTYRITVTNSGELSGSYDVVDTFTLGTGFSLTNATLVYGGESDGVDGTILTPFTSGDQVITGESLAGLQTESWLVTATFAVDKDLFDPTQDCTNGGGFGNQISVTGDTNSSNDTACVPVEIGGIEITKDGVYIDSDANGLTNVGDVVDYTFVVTNTGNVAISNVIVSDPLLGGAIAGPASGDTDGDSELDITETWVYTASYSIIQTDIDNGQVNNLATVTGEDPDGTTVTDTSTDPTPCTTCTPDPTCTDCTLTELPSNPSIDAAKTIESGPIYNSATDEHTVTYRITVTNSGELSGSYDVVDTFTLGTGFSLTNATLVYGGETDGVDGTILTPFTSGDQVITGESLAGLQTESWLVTATFTVDKDLFDPSQDCTNGGGFGNQIIVTGDTDPSNDTACVPVEIGGIEITKDGAYVDSDANGLTNVGDAVDYTFVVTNNGNVAISNVIVSDPLLGGAIAGPASGDTDGNGELDITETWVYTASYSIIQTDIDNGQVNNLATVTGEDPDGTTVTDTSTDPTPCTTCTPDPTCTDCTLTELPSNPSIDAAKTIESGPIYNSATDEHIVTYRITVTNSGELAGSYDLVDTFTLGTGFTLTNATLVYGGESDGVDGTILTPFTSGDQVITGESLAGLQTESWLVTATFTINKNLFDPTQDCTNGGGFGNQITVTGDTDSSNDTACVPVSIGRINITKDGVYVDLDTNGLTNVGDVVDYTFVVTNTSNVAISNVIVSDPLLGGAIAGPASGDTDGDGELDTTEIWVYTASYNIIQSDIDNGQVNNLATVTGEDPDGTTVTDTSTDPTPCATCTPDPTCTDCTLTELPSTIVDIALTKTVDVGSARIGDEINFMITASNIGTVTTTTIAISEVLPNGFEYIEHSTTMGVYDESTALWNIDVMTVGQVAELQIRARVVEGSNYLNIVNLMGLDQIDMNPSNDEAQVEVEIDEPICAIEIFNVFTPNNDNVNEVFQIACIENYPNNNVQVFNRWGVKVFEEDQYNNTWDGTSQARTTLSRDQKLPVGTYYYILDLGDGTKNRTGWLYINK